MRLSVTVNGRVYEREVPEHRTLLGFLRDDLGLTGTKEGCGAGECGACTVFLNGQTVNSCMVLAVEADGARRRDDRGRGPRTASSRNCRRRSRATTRSSAVTAPAA